MSTKPPGNDDVQDLRRKLNGLKWLVLWALLFGLGIGFYAGYVIGLDVGRTEIPTEAG